MVHALVHLQGFAAHSAAVPVGGLGHVKPGEDAQIKGAGGLFHIDIDFVVACIQCRNSRLAHIQTGQLVLAAIQPLQFFILAHIQTGQPVSVAIQKIQSGILAHIQTGQLVLVAIQILQFCVLAQIQTGQLVCGAIQFLQCCILAHIQPTQLVYGAIQFLQVGEELDAFQGFHELVLNIDHSGSIPLTLAEGIIIVLIKFCLDVSSEIGVREVGSVNGNGITAAGGRRYRGHDTGIGVIDLGNVQDKGSVDFSNAAVLVGHLSNAFLHRQGAVSVLGGTLQVSDPAYIKVSGQDAGV